MTSSNAPQLFRIVHATHGTELDTAPTQDEAFELARDFNERGMHVFADQHLAYFGDELQLYGPQENAADSERASHPLQLPWR